MKLASAAPRDSASRPKAPVPQKASSTMASTNTEPPSSVRWPCSSTSNSAWRVRSAVGRISRPAGASSLRPLSRPATIRIGRFRPARGGKAELLAHHLGRHFLDGTARQFAELEGSVGSGDQPAHGPAEMLAKFADIAALAFGEGDGEPGIDSLLPIE